MKLAKSNWQLQSKVVELEAANDSLRKEVVEGARRLQAIMGQLALVEERVGHQELARLIRAIAAEPSNPSRETAWALLSECARQPSPNPTALTPHLAAREREVLRLITEGIRSPCIAERLGIAVGTVEVHRRNIMRKLGLHSVAALTKYAIREGLTSL